MFTTYKKTQTYMPYSGVMLVAFPVTWKRKENSLDTVQEEETMTIFISPIIESLTLSLPPTHPHTRTYTHRPTNTYRRKCIHSTYQPASSHTQLGQIWGLFRRYLFTVDSLLNIWASTKIRILPPRTENSLLDC